MRTDTKCFLEFLLNKYLIENNYKISFNSEELEPIIDDNIFEILDELKFNKLISKDSNAFIGGDIYIILTMDGIDYLKNIHNNTDDYMNNKNRNNQVIINNNNTFSGTFTISEMNQGTGKIINITNDNNDKFYNDVIFILNEIKENITDTTNNIDDINTIIMNIESDIKNKKNKSLIQTKLNSLKNFCVELGSSLFNEIITQINNLLN